MKGKKSIFLIAALLLPVAIFIFLKIFGKNEFQVPPLHQEGIIEVSNACHYRYATPYYVPDSLFAQFGANKHDSLYVLYFDPSLKVSMNRVSVEYRDASVTVVPPSAFSPETDTQLLRQCVLLMRPPASVVLLDRHNRIRGYYDASDRDEVDRLLVEIDIILKNY